MTDKAHPLPMAYQNIRDKVMAGIERQPNGCWTWTKGKTVRFHKDFKSSVLRAVAIAWHIVHPDDASHVARICGNWQCVNPDHVFLRRDERLRAAWEKLGVIQSGARCPSAKLSDQDVLEIRRRAAKGDSYFDIAKDYGVNPESCRLIARHKTRRRVGGPITYRERHISPLDAAQLRLDADAYFLKHHTQRGMSRMLAQKYGLSQGQVCGIIAGRVKHTPRNRSQRERLGKIISPEGVEVNP